MKAYPQLVSTELAAAKVETALLELLGHRNSLVRERAASVLAFMMETKPEAITSEMTEFVVAFFIDEGCSVGSLYEGYEVKSVVVVNPEFATIEVTEALIKLLTNNKNREERTKVVCALQSVLKANSEVATMEVSVSLVELLTDNNQESEPLSDLLAQVGSGRAIILMAYANKNACYAIKMMALPIEF